jgi:hypothetical protein
MPQANNDQNGQCTYCGRDNRGHEHEPCSDDCPYEPTDAAIAWQLARMDTGATEADARALLIDIADAIERDDDDDQVCRNGKPWADCTCC